MYLHCEKESIVYYANHKPNDKSRLASHDGEGKKGEEGVGK